MSESTSDQHEYMKWKDVNTFIALALVGSTI